MESLCQNIPNSFITWKLRTTRGSQTFHLDCLVFLTLLSAAFYWFLQSSVELRNILNTLNWKHTLALNSKLLLGKVHVKLKWKTFTPVLWGIQIVSHKNTVKLWGMWTPRILLKMCNAQKASCKTDSLYTVVCQLIFMIWLQFIH